MEMHAGRTSHRRRANRHPNNHGSTFPRLTDMNNEWETKMGRKFEEKPTLLGEKAGRSSCCIFRVPQSLVEINREAYHPRIVSVGPYHHHHRSEHLKMIEEHKRRFLCSLFRQNEDPWGNLDRCFKVVASLEADIRECYSETIRFESEELVEMMVVDGCFIIELVCEVLNPALRDSDDPIFKMGWILPFVMRDLLKIENQIPFFVLRKLFEISAPVLQDPRDSLPSLILKFFSYSLEQLNSARNNATDFDGKHLLDLVRGSFQPQFRENTVRPNNSHPRLLSKKKNSHPRFIQPAKKLDRDGIKFQTRESGNTCFLDVKFSNGVLKIPPLRMDDFITCFILNCVAFEQCYGHCETKFFTDYATFMGSLINSPSDAGFLSDRKIIENYYGTDEEVTRFFDRVRKDVAFELDKSYLCKLIQDVSLYYGNYWHVKWASFMHTYFDTPWSFMSAMAALILLILTMIQAFMALLAYFRPPKFS